MSEKVLARAKRKNNQRESKNLRYLMRSGRLKADTGGGSKSG